MPSDNMNEYRRLERELNLATDAECDDIMDAMDIVWEKLTENEKDDLNARENI